MKKPLDSKKKRWWAVVNDENCIISGIQWDNDNRPSLQDFEDLDIGQYKSVSVEEIEVSLVKQDKYRKRMIS